MLTHHVTFTFASGLAKTSIGVIVVDLGRVSTHLVAPFGAEWCGTVRQFEAGHEAANNVNARPAYG